MCDVVTPQIAAAGEGLAAHLAPEGLLPGVPPAVREQRVAHGEALAADVACEGLLVVVRAAVDDQRPARAQHLATQPTPVQLAAADSHNMLASHMHVWAYYLYSEIFRD